MKKCCRCGEYKSEDQFQWKKTGIERHYHCKQCQSTIAHDWYVNNKKRTMARVRVRNDRIKADNRQFIVNYLSSHPCVKCGESDPVVLDFHHLRDKKKEVSKMGTWSRKAIIEEIGKCEILCANCHRRAHSNGLIYPLLAKE